MLCKQGFTFPGNSLSLSNVEIKVARKNSSTVYSRDFVWTNCVFFHERCFCAKVQSGVSWIMEFLLQWIILKNRNLTSTRKKWQFFIKIWKIISSISCLYFVVSKFIFVIEYRKVVSSNTSHLEAHEGFFRLLMKGIFYPYVLWPFDKKLIL